MGVNVADGLSVFFTTKISKSAQRAQRECSYSEGVQEFGGSFANIAASFAAFVLKNGVEPCCFVTTEVSKSARGAQRAL